MGEYKDISEDFITIPDKGLFVKFPIDSGYYEVDGKSYLICCRRLAHPIKHHIEEDNKIKEMIRGSRIKPHESVLAKIKRLFTAKQSKQ